MGDEYPTTFFDGELYMGIGYKTLKICGRELPHGSKKRTVAFVP